METLTQKTPVRSYDAPAVVYEASLVTHAGVTSPPCLLSTGDLLDPTAGE